VRWIFLDRITELEPGSKAVGYKTATRSEDFFADHFPGFPVVPGVILLEALAQLSGKLLELTLLQERHLWSWPIITMADKVKFRKFVRPGQLVRLETKITDLSVDYAQTRVQAFVEDVRVTSADQTFVFDPRGLDTEAGQDRLEVHEREQFKILWEGWPEWIAGYEASRGERQ
jgi:3-hydroxyacyl-[acyl-carrier-protein] dehydratase